jgi:hypothetical protein
MKNTIINSVYGLFLLSHLFVYSQTEFNSYKIKDENPKAILTFESKTNKKNMLAIKNKENTNFILFDENYNEQTQITIDNQKISGDFIGFSAQNTIYYTYWKKNKDSFEVLTLDFNAKNNLEYSPLLTLEKKEKVLSAFNKDDKFYVVTHPKNSDVLNIFEISGTTVVKKIIDCSKTKFIDINRSPTSFSNWIEEENRVPYKSTFSVIDQNSPISNIVKATEKRKIYINNDKLILSSDINRDYSQFLFIDLKNSSAEQLTFNKGSADSNSFLIDDKIFILKFGPENALLTVRDLNNNSLKSINFSGTLGHEYRNSDLVEEIGSYTKRKIIEKEPKFFRKISGKNPSISGYYSNEKYYLTIAGVSYPQQSTAQFGMAMFGAVGAIIGELISNTTNNSVQSFSDKNILHFTSILEGEKLIKSDENYLTSNFDNVRNHIEKSKSKEVFLEPFQNQDKLILIGFDKKENKLNFYKF